LKTKIKNFFYKMRFHFFLRIFQTRHPHTPTPDARPNVGVRRPRGGANGNRTRAGAIGDDSRGWVGAWGDAGADESSSEGLG
jgi:hypothetical protein